MSLTQNETIDLSLKALAIVGATIAFLVARRDYKRGQHWQKAQILLSLIKDFEENKRITSACKMLDWDERQIPVGEGRSILFTNAELLKSLGTPEMDEVGKTNLDCFTSDQSDIRDCLDAFFDFFQKPYAFWENGLLSFDDYTYFQYWFNILHYIDSYKAVKKGEPNKEMEEAIRNYIKCYRFVGIEKLLEEYKKNPDPKMNLRQRRSTSDSP